MIEIFDDENIFTLLIAGLIALLFSASSYGAVRALRRKRED